MAERGTLVLVVGPSGVGKDSLIAYAKERAGEGFVFPRRFITRPPDTAEDHLAISTADFAAAVASGAFALDWQAHDLGYGIPVAIAGDLAAGRHVVVNVSRAVVDEARRRFAPVLVASVTATPEILAARLQKRGRESGEGIGKRLARGEELSVAGADVVTVDNSGSLVEAGEQFSALLRALSK